MTYKEMAMQEHPEISPEELEDIYCPSDLGYDEPDDCTGIECPDCWNREVSDEI